MSELCQFLTVPSSYKNLLRLPSWFLRVELDLPTMSLQLHHMHIQHNPIPTYMFRMRGLSGRLCPQLFNPQIYKLDLSINVTTTILGVIFFLVIKWDHISPWNPVWELSFDWRYPSGTWWFHIVFHVHRSSCPQNPISKIFIVSYRSGDWFYLYFLCWYWWQKNTWR